MTCTTDIPAFEFVALAPRIVPTDVELINGRTFPADVEHHVEVEKLSGRTILANVEQCAEVELIINGPAP